MSNGFYKFNGKELLYAENFVYAPSFVLSREKKDEYIYPIDGWKWFDFIEEAEKEYGIYTIDNLYEQYKLSELKDAKINIINKFASKLNKEKEKLESII